MTGPRSRAAGVAVLRDGALDLVEIGVLGLLGAERPKDVLGKQLSALIHPADRWKLAHELDALARCDGSLPFEVDLLRLDGGAERVWISIATPTADRRCIVQLALARSASTRSFVGSHLG